MVSESMKVRHELIAKFPSSKYYKDQVAALGSDYESIGDFSQAADWYEKLFTLDNKHKDAAGAIFSAAYFRKSLGQWEQSIKDYQQYMATFPDKPNLNGIRLEIGKIYQDHEKWSESSRIYLDFFTKPPAGATVAELMFCRLQYGLMADKIGQSAKVTQHWKDSLAWLQKTKDSGVDVSSGMEAAAQMMFILSEAQFNSYMAMKISGPGDKKVRQKDADAMLVRQLKEKLAALKALEQTYTDIVNTGAGAWGIAALTRMGQACENMGQTLIDAWVPTYLTEEQKEFYVMSLQDRAYPQTERAIAFYTSALGKAYELSLYNDNTAFAARRLGELRPKEYPGLFETIPTTRFSAPSVYTAEFEAKP
jgi:tetratricopeptide (TPR) repeat protein